MAGAITSSTTRWPSRFERPGAHETGHEPAVGKRRQRHIALAARFERETAAGSEGAPGEALPGRRYTPGDGDQPLQALGERQLRVSERGRVGVRRLVENGRGRPVLDGTPGIHDQHLVGDIAHHRKVVRDEHHAHAVLALQAGEQLEHVVLVGGIQRRGGLVGDHQHRPDGQSGGDGHALAHAAGELARVPARHVIRQVHVLEEAGHRLAHVAPV